MSQLDYGLHGVLRVIICGISGMRDAVSATSGKSAAVVRNFFQPIRDVSRMAAKTVTKGRMAKGNDTANAKGNVRLPPSAPYKPHEVRTRKNFFGSKSQKTKKINDFRTQKKWVSSDPPPPPSKPQTSGFQVGVVWGGLDQKLIGGCGYWTT